MLDRKQKGEKTKFPNEEIEDEFVKFWSSEKENPFPENAPASEVDDFRPSFVKEIEEK